MHHTYQHDNSSPRDAGAGIKARKRRQAGRCSDPHPPKVLRLL